MTKGEQSGTELAGRTSELVEATLELFYRQYPELKERYGSAGRVRCREDIYYHVRVLTEALIAEEVNIFLKYVAWGKSLLVNRGIRADDLVDCLLILQEAISGKLSKSAATPANNCIQLALDSYDSFADMPPSCIDPSSSLSNVANAYLEALLSSDPSQARKVIESAEKMGIGFPELYQHVFQPVQREVGRLWQVNQITVAQEHYCTALTGRFMSEVHEGAAERRDGNLFVGACVPGEAHDIGMRMVCEVMESGGWRTYFTGANTPTASVVDLVKRIQVHVVGLSCATAMYLPVVREVIAAIRRCGRATKIMVGGRMFNEFPSLWKSVGADAFAEDAESAVRVAARLLGVKQTHPARV